jgi:hypothetical protein
MRSGIASRRRPLALLTDAIAFSSSRGGEMFPTPTATDYKTVSTLGQRRGTLSGRFPGGLLNPTFVEWLIGFPVGWTDLRPSETQSFLQLELGSESGSSKQTGEPNED